MTSDCCSQPGLMPIDDARDLLLSALSALQKTEQIPLVDTAGRVLAEPVTALVDLPPCDNSAMDGYALRAQDLHHTKSLQLAGRSFAGAPFDGVVQAGECIRIMTGAAIPPGADTVVMQEHTRAENNSVVFTSREKVREGDHIRRQSEDIVNGSELMTPGTRLSTAHIALAAAAGISTVKVIARPVVAVFSTGDELRQPGESLNTGDIYDSNRIALISALRQLGTQVLDLGVLPDDREAIAGALARAASEADAIVTSGGVSVGEADYTREMMERDGTLDLWKIAMKPGKPFAFGHLQGTPFFGLPGNPVSALVTFYLLVVPALSKLAGRAVKPPLILRASLEGTLRKKPGRTDFQRGVFSADGQGNFCVAPVGLQGSNILSGLAGANCLIVLPQESGDATTGSIVKILPLTPPLA